MNTPQEVIAMLAEEKAKRDAAVESLVASTGVKSKEDIANRIDQLQRSFNAEMEPLQTLKLLLTAKDQTDKLVAWAKDSIK